MNFIARIALAATSGLLGQPALSQSETLGELARLVEPRAFVNAFVGYCGQNPGRLDIIGQAAEVSGFMPIPDDLEFMIAPASPDAHFAGWLVMEGQGAPFLLGISEADWDGEVYQTCVVANPFMASETTILRLEELMGLKAVLADETEAGQRLRIWDASHVLDGTFISLTDIGALDQGGTTIGISAPKQY